MNGPTRLEELYSPGTKLAEVKPEFTGMDRALWNRLKLDEQFAAYYRTLDSASAPLSKKAVASPRDSYGMKGM